MPKDATQRARLYRMVMPDHLCSYGLNSKNLLEREGFEVEEHPLTTREETDAFMEKHGVETTPQTWIGDERIGGYDDFRVHFGIDAPEDERSDTSYQPVIAIFAVAFLMALSLSWYSFDTFFTLRGLEWFISISMCFLAVQKLQDVESFSTVVLHGSHHRNWATTSGSKAKRICCATHSSRPLKIESIRCLKRYIAREVFNIIARRHKQINQAQIAA